MLITLNRGTDYEMVEDTFDLHHGKYSCSMVAFLSIIGSDYEDESGGSIEGAVGYVQRFGKWLVFGNDHGFVTGDKYPSAELAHAAFDACMVLAYAGEDDNGSPLDDDAMDAACDNAGTYCAYAVALASAGTMPDDYETWTLATIEGPSRDAMAERAGGYVGSTDDADELIRDASGALVLDRFPAHAWPGGYPIGYVTDDADLLCADCVTDEASIRFAPTADADGWRIDGLTVLEGNESAEHCAHCNRLIAEGYDDNA